MIAARSPITWIPAACLVLLLAAMPVRAEGVPQAHVIDDYPNKETLEASILRGAIVFLNYCTLCHGINADGRGRAARIYTPKPADLRKSTLGDASKESIIRKGGKAVGRSMYMPPWGDELTDEQVADVVAYLRSIAPADAPR